MGGYNNVIPTKFLEGYIKEAYKKPQEPECNLLFVYGILKRGHVLDLRFKGAKFVDVAQLEGAMLYEIGGGVGLRFTKDLQRDAYGEVFEIPTNLWKWLDSIESNGFSYTRKIVEVGVGNPEGPDFGWVKAWVYEHTFPGMKYDKPIENGVYNGHIHV